MKKNVIHQPETTESIETKEPLPEQSAEDITSPTEDTEEPTQAETQDTEPVDNKNQIAGKYVCVSNYCMNISDPDYVPYIIFNGDGSCEMFVYYVGGVTLLPGTYMVEDNKIFVEVNPAGTPVDGIDNSGRPYMDDKYVFEIIDYDHIIIGPAEGAYHNGSCYVARNGDPFVRK